MIFFERDHTSGYTRISVRDAGLRRGSISDSALHGNVTDYGEAEVSYMRAGRAGGLKNPITNRNPNSLFFIILINTTSSIFHYRKYSLS